MFGSEINHGTFSQNLKTTQTTPPFQTSALSRNHIRQGHDPDSIFDSPRRLLQNNEDERNAILTGEALLQIGHDFARIPVNPPRSGSLQMEAAINKPGGDFKQEADCVRTYMTASTYHLSARIRQPVVLPRQTAFPCPTLNSGVRRLAVRLFRLRKDKTNLRTSGEVGGSVVIEESDNIGVGANSQPAWRTR
jgi:hypothetical protein